MKDCLNYYNYGKPRHFARDCSEQDKSTPKQGNARDCALTQGEVESGTSQVVARSYLWDLYCLKKCVLSPYLRERFDPEI